MILLTVALLAVLLLANSSRADGEEIVVPSLSVSENMTVLDAAAFHNHSHPSHHARNEDALDAARGVFKSADLYPQYAALLNKTVVVTACNYGFLNHLMNFYCIMERMQMKFVVISLDNRLHHFLTTRTNISSIQTFTDLGGTYEGSTTFRSKEFNVITAKKKEAVHNVLKMGYDVLFSDTDVAVVRDPFPYLLQQLGSPQIDYVHSLNVVCAKENTWDFYKSKKEEGNTGFYFVRSNARTIKLWERAYKSVADFKGLDDQAVFWRVIRTSQDPKAKGLGLCKKFVPTQALLSVAKVEASAKVTARRQLKPQELTTCFLDPCVFSSGMLSRVWVPEYTYEELLVNVALRNDTIAVVHANYIKGNKAKQQRMAEHGFWLAYNEEKHIKHSEENKAADLKIHCRDMRPH